MAGGGDDAGVGDGLELTLRLGTPMPAPAPRKNGVTIAYDRRALCAADAVELQAIAIISMAKNITDDGGGAARLGQRGSCKAMIPTWRAAHASAPASQDGIVAPSPLGDQGLSMKRSLQRFLEKRKARASSPYGTQRLARRPRS